MFTEVEDRCCQHRIGSSGHDTFDEVLAIWYPSRQAFLDLTSDPAYQEALAHREAALETSALIPCVGEADAALRSPF